MATDVCPLVEADPALEAAVLDTFRRVVATMPWYRALLDERGVSPASVCDLASFAALCPRLDKRNTFQRFTVQQLAATTPVTELAGVLTSSGHGGRFSFGLTTRSQEAFGAEAIDGALDAAFGVRATPTLAINCLPMGVTFASRCMTVATTSVREDMAVALVETFGAAYAQVLLVADPLFLKRLVDHARARGLDWHRHRVQVVVGEEVFGERFRAYMAAQLGLGRAGQPDTFLMSSFGVGELGLHLLYETRATAALRRLVADDQALAHALLGPTARTRGLPVFFTHDATRLHLEVVEPDADGFGTLAVSMLDPSLPIPLLRYQTGDVARLLDGRAVRHALASAGRDVAGELPARLVALRGREREALPNGATVTLYKDALYAEAAIADRLTGAMRMSFDEPAGVLHVQLVPGCDDERGVADALREVLPAAARPGRTAIWRYEAFPFGMTLDYERKFVGYAPA